MPARPLPLIALLALIAPAPAVAQSTYTWSPAGTPASGGSGNWTGGFPFPWYDTYNDQFTFWSNPSDAMFEGTAGTVTLSSNVTTFLLVEWVTSGYVLTPNNSTPRSVVGDFYLTQNVGLTLFNSTATDNRTLT